MSVEPTASAPARAEGLSSPGESAPPGRAAARNTAIFSVLTGLSRIAGLAREIVASSYFATSGAFSAFTIAFQVPNVLRSLFADAALSAAFVPVFTELLEHGKRKEAFKLASTLFFLILTVLSAIMVLFILFAGVIMPVFVGDELSQYTDLTVGLSRVLFPVVVILGLNGLVVGILNAYEHFTIPALSPLVWNGSSSSASLARSRCSPATTSSTATRSASWWGRSSSSRWPCRCCASSASTWKSRSRLARSARAQASCC